MDEQSRCSECGTLREHTAKYHASRVEQLMLVSFLTGAGFTAILSIAPIVWLVLHRTTRHVI